MNIGVIGCGHWGKNLVRNYFELDSLYAVCEIDPKKREEFKTTYPDIKIFSDYLELLQDKNIDGIVIATPAPTHFELAKASLETGIPTYIEKPMTLSLKEAEYLTELAESKDLQLMVGHILEYHPAILKMKELTDKGIIGKIKHIRNSCVNFGKIRSNESAWWSLAPHSLSAILMLLEKTPAEIQAKSFNSIQKGIADTVYADLFFDEGESAHIHASWLEPNKIHQTVVIGESGMLSFDATLKEDQLTLHKYSFDGTLLKESTNIEYEKDEPLKLECKHFIESIKNDTSPKTDGKSACRIIKILEQADQKLKGKELCVV